MRQLFQDVTEQIARESLVKTVGTTETIEDSVARVALDKNSKFAHIDAVGNPERRVYYPAARRFAPARAETELKRIDQAALARLHTSQEGLLCLEVAARVSGEQAEGVGAVEGVGRLVVYGPAGAQDGEPVVYLLPVVWVKVDDSWRIDEVVGVDFDAQLGR